MLAALIRRLTPIGIAGFVVGAMTGEAPLLGDAERQAVLDTVVRSMTLPRVVGVSAATTSELLRRARRRPAGRRLTPLSRR